MYFCYLGQMQRFRTTFLIGVFPLKDVVMPVSKLLKSHIRRSQKD